MVVKKCAAHRNYKPPDTRKPRNKSPQTFIPRLSSILTASSKLALDALLRPIPSFRRLLALGGGLVRLLVLVRSAVNWSS